MGWKRNRNNFSVCRSTNLCYLTKYGSNNLEERVYSFIKYSRAECFAGDIIMDLMPSLYVHNNIYSVFDDDNAIK